MPSPNNYRRDLERIFSDLDVAHVGGTELHGYFSSDYTDALGVSAIEPVFRLPTHRIEGTEAIATIAIGTTVGKIVHRDGSTTGPYAVREVQRSNDGTRRLVLEDA
jgi:hypothetical protein